MERLAAIKTYTAWHREEQDAAIEMFKARLHRKAIAEILKKTPAAIASRRALLLDTQYSMKLGRMVHRNPHNLPMHGPRTPYGMSKVIARKIAKLFRVK
jgi:hypothetical protein